MLGRGKGTRGSLWPRRVGKQSRFFMFVCAQTCFLIFKVTVHVVLLICCGNVKCLFTSYCSTFSEVFNIGGLDQITKLQYMEQFFECII